jgi:hypothetical protein
VSVAQILEQMAFNAGRTQRIKGAIYGNLVNDAAQVPGQILNDHEMQRMRALQEARQAEQLGFQRNADARAQSDQAMQVQAVAAEQVKAQKAEQDRQERGAIMSAGLDPASPGKWNFEPAIVEAMRRGRTDIAKELTDQHEKHVQDTRPKTRAELAADAANPTSPTQAQSTTALDLETPPKVEPAKPVGPIHDTPGGLMRIGADGVATPVVDANNQPVRGYHPPVDAGNVPLGGLSGEALLAKMSPEQKAQSQALVDGRRTLDARMASTPFGKTIIAGAYAIDPTFDQGNYNARAKARADLVSPNGTGGKTIGALNTAIQHAGKLSDLIETLDNSNMPLVNAIVNPLRSAGGSTAVTNFDTVAPQLAKEIERVWRGAGGTAGEIHDLIETIGHNKSKQQQREALQQFVELAKGKLDSLERQRDSALGETVGKTIPILYPQNQPIIDTIAQRASGKPATVSAAGGGVSVTDPQGGVHVFPTQAAADAFKKAAGIK